MVATRPTITMIVNHRRVRWCMPTPVSTQKSRRHREAGATYSGQDYSLTGQNRQSLGSALWRNQETLTGIAGAAVPSSGGRSPRVGARPAPTMALRQSRQFAYKCSPESSAAASRFAPRASLTSYPARCAGDAPGVRAARLRGAWVRHGWESKGPAASRRQSPVPDAPCPRTARGRAWRKHSGTLAPTPAPLRCGGFVRAHGSTAPRRRRVVTPVGQCGVTAQRMRFRRACWISLRAVQDGRPP